MNTNSITSRIARPITVIVLGAVALATPAGSEASGHRPASRTTSPLTPNDCIRLNGGDYNACNVGNRGRGDLPYRPVHDRTPDDCIRLNGGDYNACNVGNSGRGDLPYRPVK